MAEWLYENQFPRSNMIHVSVSADKVFGVCRQSFRCLPTKFSVPADNGTPSFEPTVTIF